MAGELEMGTITVKGQEFTVYVDSKGRFYCNTSVPHDRSGRRERPNLEDGDPNVVEARTLIDLQKKALKHLGAKKIAIDCWQYEERNVMDDKEKIVLRHGVIIAMHSNGNAMVKWDDKSQTEQVKSYWRHLLKLDTKEKRDKLLALYKAKRQAEKDFNSYEYKMRMDPRLEVNRALGVGANENKDTI